jgi:hypothetical protein
MEDFLYNVPETILGTDALKLSTESQDHASSADRIICRDI